MAKSTRILGIDPGSRFTGYGVIDKRGNRLTFVAAGRYALGSLALPLRLEAIYDQLTETINEHAPDEAAIEGLFFARNADSALKLGHARGVAILACRHRGLELGEYQPSLVKQAVTGKGRASKEQVAKMVTAVLGPATARLELDASDALAVAICHAQRSPFESLVS